MNWWWCDDYLVIVVMVVMVPNSCQCCLMLVNNGWESGMIVDGGFIPVTSDWQWLSWLYSDDQWWFNNGHLWSSSAWECLMLVGSDWQWLIIQIDDWYLTTNPKKKPLLPISKTDWQFWIWCLISEWLIMVNNWCLIQGCSCYQLLTIHGQNHQLVRAAGGLEG